MMYCDVSMCLSVYSHELLYVATGGELTTVTVVLGLELIIVV